MINETKETYECADCGALFTMISVHTPEYCIVCGNQDIFITEELENDTEEYD